MPPKAPESKAAKAAKAMAGGKKKAKVRARDGETRSRGDPKRKTAGNGRAMTRVQTRGVGVWCEETTIMIFKRSGPGVSRSRAIESDA
jgi:hypothetical protein